ncbi:MAG: S8 family serine peptidase, partial [Patescibacteria group bacterium]
MTLLMARVFLLVFPLIVLGAGKASAQSLVTAFVPNDPEYYRLDYLRQTRLDGAWDVARAHVLDRSVVVAVLDTGVAIDHPDLANTIWVNDDEIPGDGIDNDGNSFIDDVNGWDFLQSVPDPRPKFDDGYGADAVNHGTVIAGILAAEADNNIGIPGAGLRVTIMPIRVLDSKGAGSTLLLSQAIDYAVENGADVINLSLVGQDRDWRLEASIEAAYKSGVAIVAASGNQEAAGIDLNTSPRYPICEQEGVNRIIGVAAVDEQFRLAPFSNYGSACIDLAAPGVNFYSTVVYDEQHVGFDKYYSGGWTGTSAAAPLISATLAMIRQVAPQLPLSDVYRALLTSSRSLAAANLDQGRLGAGLLDGERAMLTAIDLSRSYQYRA